MLSGIKTRFAPMPMERQITPSGQLVFSVVFIVFTRSNSKYDALGRTTPGPILKCTFRYAPNLTLRMLRDNI